MSDGNLPSQTHSWSQSPSPDQHQNTYTPTDPIDNETNRQRKRLPLEIWLLVLLHAQDPSNLTRTCRAIHSISLSPVIVTQWLLRRFTTEFAFLGALAWWTIDNPVWKHWIICALKQMYGGDDADVELLLPETNRRRQRTRRGRCGQRLEIHQRDSGEDSKNALSAALVAARAGIARITTWAIRQTAEKYRLQGLPNRARFRCPRCNGTGFVDSASHTAHRHDQPDLHTLHQKQLANRRAFRISNGKIVPMNTNLNSEFSIQFETNEHDIKLSVYGRPSDTTLVASTRNSVSIPNAESTRFANTVSTPTQDNRHLCPFEEQQIVICRLLLSRGADLRCAYSLLLRYAARAGHLRLLSFLISSVSLQSSRTHDELVIAVLILLVRAASKRDSVIVACIARCGVELARVRGGNAWANAIGTCIMHQDVISVTALLTNSPGRIGAEAIVLSSRIVSNLRWRPFVKRSRVHAAAAVLDNLVRHTPQSQLDLVRDVAIIAACESGHPQLIRHLIKRGADINTQENLPILSCVLLGNVAVIRMLVSEFPQTQARRVITGSKLVLVVLVMLDHVAVWYSAVTSTIALGVSTVCAVVSPGSASAFAIFGLFTPDPVTGSWCVVNHPMRLTNGTNTTMHGDWTSDGEDVDGYTNMHVWQIAIAWVVFALVVVSLQWAMPTHRVIACLFVCMMARPGMDADAPAVVDHVGVDQTDDAVVEIDDHGDAEVAQ